MDLGPVLRDVQEIGAALAEGKPVQVTLDAPESLPVRGSVGGLRRLLLNLVSNAVKFTDAGTVALRAAEETTGDGARRVRVSVRDTGTGIAAEHLPRVFDRFYRVDEARERGGSGLGLAIARMIAEQHGGTLEAHSAPGAGSEFVLTLPLP